MGARTGNDLAREDHVDVAAGVIRRIEHRLVQVELGVREGAGHGLLRACKHDGLLAVLDQIRKRRGRIGHGVGAVQHHKAVVAVICVHNDVADLEPVARAHVGAVDVHGLDKVQVGDGVKQGHLVCQLAPRGSGRKATGLAVRRRGNGSARGDDQDALPHVVPFRPAQSLTILR